MMHHKRALEKLKAEYDRSQKEGLEHHAIAVEYYEKLEAIKKIIDEPQPSLQQYEKIKKILEAEA